MPIPIGWPSGHQSVLKDDLQWGILFSEIAYYAGNARERAYPGLR
ncbi:MAG: hypothetical protein ACOYMG_16575 [Candidatus Methylumidiphilus sp.]